MQVRLLASHTDSPSLKLKPHAEIHKCGSLLLGLEIYGSPILHSWLNRDLGLAGRVLYLNSSQVLQESIVRLDQYPITIPQLAIHLDREVNEKGPTLHKQEHLAALVGIDCSKIEGSFLETILRNNCDCQQLIAHDLFTFPLEPARLIGYPPSLLTSYRIDSLTSVHAALHALLTEPQPLENEMKMVIFWDNEEVGSKTAQGAESPFFNQVLERVIYGFKGNREDYFQLINRSTCISIDLAHALHPNYVDKHDTQHQPLLGKGVVVKHNAQQRYATNTFSLQTIYAAAKKQNLSLQKFVSRNDLSSGTTIGPIHAATTGMNTIDIGCGQLSMHACRELISCQDHLDMCALLRAVLQ
jgi:aspartyl aminopeptidase